MDQSQLQAAIDKARLEEREACALIADHFEEDPNCVSDRADFWAEQIAISIRQRGTGMTGESALAMSEAAAALTEAQATIARLTKALQDIKGLETSDSNANDIVKAMASIAGGALSPVKWGK